MSEVIGDCCCTGGCCEDSVVPTQWQLTVEGIAETIDPCFSSGTQDCSEWNGTWILDLDETETSTLYWRVTEAEFCICDDVPCNPFEGYVPATHHWALICGPGGKFFLSAEGTYLCGLPIYELAIEDFDCMGANVMTSTGHPSPCDCNSTFPATVTITPV